MLITQLVEQARKPGLFLEPVTSLLSIPEKENLGSRKSMGFGRLRQEWNDSSTCCCPFSILDSFSTYLLTVHTIWTQKRRQRETAMAAGSIGICFQVWLQNLGFLPYFKYIYINGYPHYKTPTTLPSNTVRLCLRAGAVSFERVQIFLALSRARNQCCGIGNAWTLILTATNSMSLRQYIPFLLWPLVLPTVTQKQWQNHVWNCWQVHFKLSQDLTRRKKTLGI